MNKHMPPNDRLAMLRKRLDDTRSFAAYLAEREATEVNMHVREELRRRRREIEIDGGYIARDVAEVEESLKYIRAPNIYR